MYCYNPEFCIIYDSSILMIILCQNTVVNMVIFFFLKNYCKGFLTLPTYYWNDGYVAPHESSDLGPLFDFAHLHKTTGAFSHGVCIRHTKPMKYLLTWLTI